MATNAMDEVKRLVGQSSPAFSPRHLDTYSVDITLLTALLDRWQRTYRAETPDRADVALFRSLNMANSAALLPGGPEATMYDIWPWSCSLGQRLRNIGPIQVTRVLSYLRFAEEG